MAKNKTTSSSDLFIVDNSDRDWKVRNYLSEWADIAKSFDVATGYFEIGALLALDGQWQKLEKLRILMGDEVSKRTKKALLAGIESVKRILDQSIEREKETNEFLTGVPAIVEALREKRILCRVYTKDKFHAKAYITHAKHAVVGPSALVGSSNFTYPGITQNVELNVQLRREVEILQEWYERHWKDAQDITEEVLKVIERHTKKNENAMMNNDFTKKIFVTYDYKNESDQLLYQVVRYEPKDFRQRRPDGNGDWIWNLQGVRRVLYRLQELLQASPEEWIFIVEGEKDVDRLYDEDLIATTCAMGAVKWEDDYSEFLNDRSKVAIIPDNDDSGRRHAKAVAESLAGVGVKARILELPGLPEKGDVSDWLDAGGCKEELIKLAEKTTPFESIDISQFKPMSSQELIDILGLTIKRDQENKLITFLCELAAYTESSQFNISFNAPSSTGKSYIPTEIARLFPKEDVIEIGHCSPTAFFHDVGDFVKGKGYIVDLSRKILIFLDQPHTQLLERLRPLLSHDKKEINLKITDKTQKFGLRTKNVLLRGYPAVIFCTAGLKIDEQEATRFLLLSPETNQEKIREAIYEKLKKETDTGAYQRWLDGDLKRQLLIKRIRAIKQECINEIKIGRPERIGEAFFKDKKALKPRHTRDIGRLISLVKSFALLNLWFRDKDNSTIVADESDIEEAFKIWDTISESQELNLPPYIYQLHQEVILLAWYEKNEGRAGELEEVTGKLGLTRQDIIQKHYEVYGRFIPDWQLRQQIIPMLETAGLIFQEKDPTDKRKILIYPTALLTNSDSDNQGNSEQGGDKFPEEIVSWGVG